MAFIFIGTEPHEVSEGFVICFFISCTLNLSGGPLRLSTRPSSTLVPSLDVLVVSCRICMEAAVCLGRWSSRYSRPVGTTLQREYVVHSAGWPLSEESTSCC